MSAMSNAPRNDAPRQDELPIADYDGLSAGELEHRIRPLTAEDLERVVAYERAHAHRAPVLQLLTSRQAELADGAEPSPGGTGRPEAPGPTRGGSPVGPETSPQPFSAPPHGSPHQQGRPKGDDRSP